MIPVIAQSRPGKKTFLMKNPVPDARSVRLGWHRALPAKPSHSRTPYQTEIMTITINATPLKQLPEKERSTKVRCVENMADNTWLKLTPDKDMGLIPTGWVLGGDSTLRKFIQSPRQNPY